MSKNPIVRTIVALQADPKVRSATHFISPYHVVRATRRHKHRSRDKRFEYVLTIGQPNFRERKFVRTCLRAGEPFPVRKVQLRFYPKARK